MLDKLRLHATGRLPAEYATNLGDRHPLFADGRCCRFLGVHYADLRPAVLGGLNDTAALEWAEMHGIRRSDEECEVWNGYMMKLGWRDPAAARLRERAEKAGLGHQPIETMFDLMDFDEDRNPIARRAWRLEPPRAVIVMGVSGSGKTTIGRKLADALGWDFHDGDEFHSPANVAKMASGVPLTDDDRWPWLDAIHARLQTSLAGGDSAVIACSALRSSYRERLTHDLGRVRFVFLSGDDRIIHERLSHRTGHFMKPEMLQSQLATLEPPLDAIVGDIAQDPDTIVAEVLRHLSP